MAIHDRAGGAKALQKMVAIVKETAACLESLPAVPITALLEPAEEVAAAFVARASSQKACVSRTVIYDTHTHTHTHMHTPASPRLRWGPLFDDKSMSDSCKLA